MKLYKRVYVGQVPNEDGTASFQYPVATPEEIKDAHPKCGECRHWTTGGGYHITTYCTAFPAPASGMNTEATDYCNQWEAK